MCGRFNISQLILSKNEKHFDEFDQDEEIEDDKIEKQTYLSYEPYKFFETYEEACAGYFFEINNKKIK